MATQVLPCNCVSVENFEVKCAGVKRGLRFKATVPYVTRTAGADYQDQKFGLGQRLHNIGGKGSAKTATCTVCGRSKLI